MSSQVENFKIGLFVVTSILLAVAIGIWLGYSRFFEDSKTVVAYFVESVQGLETDSPVKFKGVPVGRVRAIRMGPDGRHIEVLMGLDRNFKLSEDLGVKMNLLGLTGLKYLEMDTFRPDQQKDAIVLSSESRYPVLPTYPSDIKEFGSALENIFQRSKAVDIETISRHLLRVTARLDKILADPKLDNAGSDVADAVKEIKESAKRINDEVSRAQFARNVNKTFEKTSELLQEGAETVRSADRMIRRTDNNLNRLSQKLDRSADNLADFTRIIRQKPSSVFLPWGGLFGSDEKPGEKK
jgi:phospholipid/cholesterol/gamma-HCH transport system substrate-binding protein